MAQEHRDFIENHQVFALIGDTTRMRTVKKGLDRLGKTVWMVHTGFIDEHSRFRASSLKRLAQSPEAVICEGNADLVRGFVDQVAEAGVSKLWISVLGRGTTEVVAQARSLGIEPIHSECPVIYIPVDLPGHWCHRLAWKAAGKY